MTRLIYYFYPVLRRVSFSVIAKKHCEQLRKYFRLYEMDELALPYIEAATKPLLILQPYFYPLQKYESRLARKRHYFNGLIGIDVADSTHITPYAVSLTEYADALIVPSNFAKRVYEGSGVKKPVHVVPHGVDESWIDAPPSKPSKFKHISDLKEKLGCKLLLSFIVHSEYRKGLDILLEIYRRLYGERRDVALVIKTMHGAGYISKPIDYKMDGLDLYLEWRVSSEWFSEGELMELIDICDVFLLTSRGGGFEHPALQALSRGLPVIAAKGGAWDDYLPEWSLVESVRSGRVLENNPIHDGYGVEMVLEKAVDKTIDVLDNLEEYKVRVKDYVDTHVRNELTWGAIGRSLRDIVEEYV